MPQRISLSTVVRRGRGPWSEWPAPVRRSRRLAATATFLGALALAAALSASAGDAVPAAALPPEDAAQLAAPSDSTQTAPAAPAEPPAPPATTTTTTVPPTSHPLAAPETATELAPPLAAPLEVTAEPAAEAPAEAVVPAPKVVVSKPSRAQARPRPAPKTPAKTRDARRHRSEPLLRSHARQRPVSELEPEATLPGVEATVWLHRSLPDPTPPAKRLSPRFAQHLRFAAREAGVDWALMLGALRARGRTGASPAGLAELRLLAGRITALRGGEERGVALALAVDSEQADRMLALRHYYRAVGLRALVRGLEWAKPRLEARLLRDDRVATYDGGRFDVDSGHVDVRVLVLIAYLAESYGEVTVSSLKTGHRLYSRPGVISAHVYGLAVDISALGGVPIAGNQEPGGLTEEAVRAILLLPSELQPKQVISLLGLGGPSLAMGDHGDHIHVGY